MYGALDVPGLPLVGKADVDYLDLVQAGGKGKCIHGRLLRSVAPHGGTSAGHAPTPSSGRPPGGPG